MSKKKNHRRWGKQAGGASGHGNPSALRSLAERQPEIAARHVRQELLAISSATTPRDIEIISLAEQLAFRLRREGKLVVARELAEAGARCSVRLRLERMLCAFASGDDAAVASLAASDASLLPIGTIVSQAAAGVPPSAPPESSPPGVRALHAVASAAACAMRGEVKRAVRWAHDVKEPLRAAFLADEMATAVTFAAKPLTKDTRSRASSMMSLPAGSYEVVRRAVVSELMAKAPKLGLDIARHYGMGYLVERRALLQTLRHNAGEGGRSGASVTVGQILPLLRQFRSEAFGGAHRPAWLLYEAFAWIGTDSRKAASALNRAVAEGADLIEALRAELLLAMDTAGPICEECGIPHGQSGREAAVAADRLARALGRDPAAAPLATAASILAVKGWLAVGNDGSMRASLCDARRFASVLPSHSLTLDILEASTLVETEPSRARMLVERVIEREPTSKAAWRLLISITWMSGGPERARELAEKAVTATGDPIFRDVVSELDDAFEDVAPLEDLISTLMDQVMGRRQNARSRHRKRGGLRSRHSGAQAQSQ